MNLGLQGARVLVTAASRGLGAATARQFSLEGARVVICSRTLETLQETASAISQESGNPVFTYPADVTDPDAAAKAVASAAEMLDGLDILVTNNGGPPAGSFDDFVRDDWEDAVRLTFMSAVNLIHTALPHLRRSGRAAILTITSMSAKQPLPNLILSNAIRPAVIGLTKSLANELGTDGIRVNSILPGLINTDRVSSLMQTRASQNNTTPDEERARAGSAVPLGRIGTPEEFANAAVFLCSQAASYITGVSLPVDGGRIQATM